MIGARHIANLRAPDQLFELVLDGVVERHTGINGVGLSDALSFAGGAIIPMISEAYTKKPEDGLVSLWERRARWSLGIAAALGLVGGVAYAGYRFLGKPTHPDDA